MYKSPIDVMIADIQHQIAQQQDEEIYKAVVSVGINVDKDELIRALRYDRDRYEEGYRDGRLSAMEEIVRCKDCKHCDDVSVIPTFADAMKLVCVKSVYWRAVEPYHFCSYGERRD